MLYILVIWVSTILYLSHKSLKALLFKFLNLCKLAKYEEKKTVVRSTATVRPEMLLKRDSKHVHTCFYAEGNKKRGEWESPYSLHPPFCFLNLVPNFQKGGGGLTRPIFFEGNCWERKRWFFSWGLQLFYIKIWIFNDKLINKLTFFSVITKNSIGNLN